MQQPPVLSLIVPTWNEADNIEPLYKKVVEALAGHDWEMVFVDDDSADGTWRRVEALSANDPRVRIIRRIGRTGLSSACVEGMAATTSALVAVMDADLQHDETLLPKMIDLFGQEAEAELVVASRKLKDASFGDMPGQRVKVSEFATYLTRLALKTDLSDPMSGFFMLRRELFNEVSHKLYGQGFKILLDICAAAARPVKIRELPYRMRARHAGESKLGIRVILEFLVFLVSQWLGRILPQRFIKFCLVGASGVGVHMLVLTLVYRVAGLDFQTGQVTAVITAMISNYVLNNQFTFADKQLSGGAFWKGLGSFMLVCSVGALIAVAVGDAMYDAGIVWWLAGLASTLAAAVWNFSLSSVITWRRQS